MKPYKISETKVRAKWVASGYKYGYYNYACNNCGCYEYQQVGLKGVYRGMNYCPNCGAKMEVTK